MLTKKFWQSQSLESSSVSLESYIYIIIQLSWSFWTVDSVLWPVYKTTGIWWWRKASTRWRKVNEECADLQWVERKQLYYSETLQKYYVRRPWLVEVKPDSSDTEQQTSSEECSDSDVDSDVQSNVESESGLMSNDFDQKIFEYYQAIREREIERKREKKLFKLRLKDRWHWILKLPTGILKIKMYIFFLQASKGEPPNFGSLPFLGQ